MIDAESQLLAEKDAEIERLKEQNESDYKIAVDVCNENTDLKKVIDDQRVLITELALGIDAVQLDTCTDEDWDRLNEVAQRAREETR
jgi:hypothetical protein